MSGIGFWELIILFLIGLIVLGPERLPRVANQIGSWLGQARRMTRVMKRQLEEEINLEEELRIKPPPPTPSVRPAEPKEPETGTSPGNEDDAYSPAHTRDAVGTGVGDDAQYDEEPDPNELAPEEPVVEETVEEAVEDKAEGEADAAGDKAVKEAS